MSSFKMRGIHKLGQMQPWCGGTGCVAVGYLSCLTIRSTLNSSGSSNEEREGYIPFFILPLWTYSQEYWWPSTTLKEASSGQQGKAYRNKKHIKDKITSLKYIRPLPR